MSAVLTLDEAADLLGLTTAQVLCHVYDGAIRVDSRGPDGTEWLVLKDVYALIEPADVDPRMLDRQPGDPS